MPHDSNFSMNYLGFGLVMPMKSLKGEKLRTGRRVDRANAWRRRDGEGEDTLIRDGWAPMQRSIWIGSEMRHSRADCDRLGRRARMGIEARECL